jgi:3-oxoadipate enol-lactonase
MSVAHIGGVDIFYQVDGNSNNPPLIFSNSLGTDHSMWDVQIPSLLDHFYVIRYDTRGHGRSSSPKGPYSIELLANDVLNLLDFLGIAKASFCGISMGGVIGQWLGVNAPDRLNKLILANTAAKVGTSTAWNERATLVRKEGLSLIAESAPARWFTAGFYAASPSVVNSLVTKLKNESAEGYASCCEALANEDLTKAISKIKSKTLIIVGIHDPVTTILDGQFMQHLINESTITELPASHISNIEAENEFNAALIQFLKN